MAASVSNAKCERADPWDVARDGQRFLLNVPPDDAAASSITVVLNWTAGLKLLRRHILTRPEDRARRP
jgi:hypothetical protein